MHEIVYVADLPRAGRYAKKRHDSVKHLHWPRWKDQWKFHNPLDSVRNLQCSRKLCVPLVHLEENMRFLRRREREPASFISLNHCARPKCSKRLAARWHFPALLNHDILPGLFERNSWWGRFIFMSVFFNHLLTRRKPMTDYFRHFTGWS